MGTPERPEAEILRFYLQLQWDRIAQLEDQRLQFSNFVIAASVVAIGLTVAYEDISKWAAAFVAVAVASSNVLAALYSARSEHWVRMHHRRSDLLIEENWEYLANVRQRAGRPIDVMSAYGLTVRLQQALHLVLVVTSVGLTAMGIIR